MDRISSSNDWGPSTTSSQHLIVGRLSACVTWTCSRPTFHQLRHIWTTCCGARNGIWWVRHELFFNGLWFTVVSTTVGVSLDIGRVRRRVLGSTRENKSNGTTHRAVAEHPTYPLYSVPSPPREAWVPAEGVG